MLNATLHLSHPLPPSWTPAAHRQVRGGRLFFHAAATDARRDAAGLRVCRLHDEFNKLIGTLFKSLLKFADGSDLTRTAPEEDSLWSRHATLQSTHAPFTLSQSALSTLPFWGGTRQFPADFALLGGHNAMSCCNRKYPILSVSNSVPPRVESLRAEGSTGFGPPREIVARRGHNGPTSHTRATGGRTCLGCSCWWVEWVDGT